MKDLKKTLEKLASDLNKVAEQVEKLVDKLEAKPVKKTAAKKVSKKNRLVIDQSAKDIRFNYSMNFEIIGAVSDHTYYLRKTLAITF